MNLFSYKTSVIIPYFNEIKNLDYTFNQLQNQTHQPDEIIFVDSNSDDDSYDTINFLIKNNNFKNIKINNYRTQFKSPSECKNYGISKSKHDWLLFMDFELKFQINWIENQLIHQFESKKDVIFGVADIRGKNKFDRSCIFQTFGYRSKTVIVPSSLVNKSIFKNYGYFLPIRSTYDSLWIKMIKGNASTYSINYKTKIDYLNFAYSHGPFHLFIKTINLCLQTLFIKNYYTPYVYLLLLLLVILFFNLKILLSLFMVNILLRGFYLPYIKNKNYFLKNLDLIIFHVTSGLIIDIGRFFGFSLALILKLLNKKIRLDAYMR